MRKVRTVCGMGQSSAQDHVATPSGQQEPNAPPGRSPFRQLVAAELPAHAARNEITGADLARRLGVSESYVSRRLGDQVPTDPDALEAMAEAMGVPLDELLLQLARLVRAGRTETPETTVPIPRQRSRAHTAGRHRQESQ